MTQAQQILHEKALALTKEHREIEFALILILQEILRTKTHKAMGKKSLFLYLIESLGFSRSVAYALKAVAERALKIPALHESLANLELTVYKASRLMPVLNLENAEELLQFAKTHTCETLDFEVARRNPKAEKRACAKPLSEDRVLLNITISKKAYERFLRARSVLAQKTSAAPSFEDVFDKVVECYLKHEDPVEKAKRSKKRSTKVRAPGKNGRTPLTAEQIHAVNRRDQGRCTHIDQDGKRCNEDRWTAIHHIINVKDGGSNEPENLTTLCSFHHNLVHGAYSWLKSQKVSYRSFRKRH